MTGIFPRCLRPTASLLPLHLGIQLSQVRTRVSSSSDPIRACAAALDMPWLPSTSTWRGLPTLSLRRAARLTRPTRRLTGDRLAAQPCWLLLLLPGPRPRARPHQPCPRAEPPPISLPGYWRWRRLALRLPGIGRHERLAEPPPDNDLLALPFFLSPSLSRALRG